MEPTKMVEAHGQILKFAQLYKKGITTQLEFEVQISKVIESLYQNRKVRRSVTRPAIMRPGGKCQEMHCANVVVDHSYGDVGCSWVKLVNGEIMSRKEANATSSRPDRTQKAGA